MVTATPALSLRALAREALQRKNIEELAARERERREGGAMLARIVRDRLGIELDVTPTAPLHEQDGIFFKAVYDGDFRHETASWALYATIVPSRGELGRAEWVRIDDLADLGAMVEEYEGPQD